MDIILANPRGFCAGVDRAIEIVKRALDTLGAPIYVRHEVVHNRYVVDELKHRGAIFVEELDEVPDGATVIFSAHGVSQAVRNEAAHRGLKVFDQMDVAGAGLAVPLPHRAFDFRMPCMPDEHHVTAGPALARDLQVHFGH